MSLYSSRTRPFIFFTVGQNVPIYPRFSSLVVFRSPRLETKHHICNLKHVLSNDDWLMFLPDSVHFGPLNSDKNTDKGPWK